jgi:hypothetical protein
MDAVAKLLSRPKCRKRGLRSTTSSFAADLDPAGWGGCCVCPKCWGLRSTTSSFAADLDPAGWGVCCVCPKCEAHFSAGLGAAPLGVRIQRAHRSTQHRAALTLRCLGTPRAEARSATTTPAVSRHNCPRCPISLLSPSWPRRPMRSSTSWRLPLEPSFATSMRPGRSRCSICSPPSFRATPR